MAQHKSNTVACCFMENQGEGQAHAGELHTRKARASEHPATGMQAQGTTPSSSFLQVLASWDQPSRKLGGEKQVG
ncbi:hypothetical protein MY11210_000382 [Beauveria gryllotalpidicola]